MTENTRSSAISSATTKQREVVSEWLRDMREHQASGAEVDWVALAQNIADGVVANAERSSTTSAEPYNGQAMVYATTIELQIKPYQNVKGIRYEVRMLPSEWKEVAQFLRERAHASPSTGSSRIVETIMYPTRHAPTFSAEVTFSTEDEARAFVERLRDTSSASIAREEKP